jgi:hypothetical protein
MTEESRTRLNIDPSPECSGLRMTVPSPLLLKGSTPTQVGGRGYKLDSHFRGNDNHTYLFILSSLCQRSFPRLLGLRPRRGVRMTGKILCGLCGIIFLIFAFLTLLREIIFYFLCVSHLSGMQLYKK